MVAIKKTLLFVVLLVEPGVDIECLGYKPHQVPVFREDPSIMKHPGLTVVLAVAVGVAVVIPGNKKWHFIVTFI